MAKHEVRIGKILLALWLNLLFFLAFAFVTTTLFPRFSMNAAGSVVAFFSATAYFFLCQWGLSRGNAEALREDWPLILALNGLLPVLVIMAILEGKLLPLLVLIPGLGGASAGAAVASRLARKRRVPECSNGQRANIGAP